MVLEIGCGAGTSTLEMARAEPDVDVIAVDVYRRGLAQLLSAMHREDVGNIRLIRGDAVDVLDHLIAPASLTGFGSSSPTRGPRLATTSAGCCNQLRLP
ncbi:methyltransferase domain protein [Mycobacterium xenopi 4042]|uniref:tRNA (guanine(46)-N(7))-methyltransferase n=1 Tax=Mycobacterium xenopi 4042 TaxID=1299334 RepID=X8BL03_MYCXE|nr:methyltransferase domain protein [Mycobacterium xenopi 3993]EUA43913.1 methyltransferase domain protein [Mycobacterium xenopi 4042]